MTVVKNNNLRFSIWASLAVVVLIYAWLFVGFRTQFFLARNADFPMVRSSGSVCPDDRSYPFAIREYVSCNFNLAIKNLDDHICEKFLGLYGYGGLVDDCRSDVAVAKQDPIVCSRISGQGRRGDCYGYVAAAAHNLELCNSATTQLEKDNCFLVYVFKNNYYDLSHCARIVDQNFKDQCYRYSAGPLGDEKICEIIQHSQVRDFCYWDVGKIKGDVDICNEIIESIWKWKCYNSVAETQQNADTCQLIQDQSEKDDCFSNVAKITKNVDTCRLVEHDRTRNLCYMLISWDSGDKTICEKISESDDQGKCYNGRSGTYGGVVE
ncbi:MAG: hypothetical protein Q7S23_01120 [bacterium]|nr:hypothetical protein [bacterium]